MTPKQIIELAQQLADVLDGHGETAVDVEMGEMADSSGRSYAIGYTDVDLFGAFRVIAPAIEDTRSWVNTETWEWSYKDHTEDSEWRDLAFIGIEV